MYAVLINRSAIASFKKFCRRLFKPSIIFNQSHFIINAGNLVTPTWWTDLWLNEGFASYVSYLGVEAVQPEFKFLEQFTVKFGILGLQNVFPLDSIGTSHPISIPVNHPDEIGGIFDQISYTKGFVTIPL